MNRDEIEEIIQQKRNEIEDLGETIYNKGKTIRKNELEAEIFELQKILRQLQGNQPNAGGKSDDTSGSSLSPMADWATRYRAMQVKSGNSEASDSEASDEDDYDGAAAWAQVVGSGGGSVGKSGDYEASGSEASDEDAFDGAAAWAQVLASSGGSSSSSSGGSTLADSLWKIRQSKTQNKMSIEINMLRSLNDALNTFETFRRRNNSGVFEIKLRHIDRYSVPGDPGYKKNRIESEYPDEDIDSPVITNNWIGLGDFRGLDSMRKYANLRIVTPEIDVLYGVSAEATPGVMPFCVFVEDWVTVLHEYAFYKCQGLISVNFPDALQEIGYEAFSGCSSLTSVTLPKGLQTIQNLAFENCDNLKKVRMSKLTSVTSSSFPEDVEFEYYEDFEDVVMDA